MNIVKTILKTTFVTSAIFLMMVFYTSCKKETPVPPNPNDEELITTIQLNFTDSAGVQPAISAIFRDADGDGGNAPSQWDSIKLKANTTYLASILLLDETKSPVDTISHEVLAEAKDHLFCFTVSNLSTTIKRTDADVNNLEIGLQSRWSNGLAGTGTVQLVLRHQPDIKDGSCAPGASDVDITFQTIVQ